MNTLDKTVVTHKLISSDRLFNILVLVVHIILCSSISVATPVIASCEVSIFASIFFSKWTLVAASVIASLVIISKKFKDPGVEKSHRLTAPVRSTAY